MINSKKYFSTQAGGGIELIEFTDANVKNKEELEKAIINRLDTELRHKNISLKDVYNKVNNPVKPINKECSSDISENIHQSVLERYDKDLIHTLFMYSK